METTVKRQIAEDYLEENPEASTRGAATALLREYPETFHSYDSARAAIRIARGEIGFNKHHTPPKPEFIRTEEEKKKAIGWKGFFPATDTEDWEPYVLAEQHKRILLLSDIHFPYHNPEALEASFEYGDKRGFDTIILNGDTIDFHAASRYVKDPRKRDLFGEIEMVKGFLADLRAYCPDTKIIFKTGNHEARYQNFLFMNCPQFAKFAQFKLNNLLDLDVLNIDFIDDCRVIKAGALNIVHGHEMGGSVFSPVNPARGLYMRAKENSICGHHHRTSSHSEQTINGSIIGTFSTGCLSELHPAYLPINNWNLGFAFVEMEGIEFHVDNKRIIKGKIY